MKSLTYSLLLIAILCGYSASGQIGINTTMPISTLDANGNVSFGVRQIGNGGTDQASAVPIDDIANDDVGYIIGLNPSPGNTTYLLPDAQLLPGRTYILRNNSASETLIIYTENDVNIEIIRNNEIGNATNPSTITMNNTGNTKTIYVYSDGFNWMYGNFGF